MTRALADLDRAFRAGLAARTAETTLADPEPPTAAAQVEGLVDALERLTALRTAGAITAEEFEAGKAKVLEAADR